MQRMGVTDESAALAELVITYLRIFGEQQGPKVFRASLKSAEVQELRGGARDGR